jgi:predicted SAM-dependent methyltransferase
MKLLNIACGKRYHKDWTNVDFQPDSHLVKKVNLLSGLSFQDESFDGIYCSHFLEHLKKGQAEFIILEAKRMLKVNGIFRIVVPDLEGLCKEYLNVLELALNDQEMNDKYEWITIELLDQLVRINGGGEMLKMFDKVSNERNIGLSEYILHRTGDELLSLNQVKAKRVITVDKIRNKLLYLYLGFIRLLIPKNLRDLIFVNTPIGERHQWMYDRYSLSKKLKDLGFKKISIKSYNESDIDNFNDYVLDIKKDGTPYKGVSSLYIEAVK